MIMKKLLGAIVLIVVILVVSYIKMIRQDRRVDVANQDGLQQGIAERAASEREVDSLTEVIEGHDLSLADSQRVWSERNRAETDSLTAIIASRDEVIQAWTDSQQAEEESLAIARQHQKPAPRYSHREILAYYKERYRALPKDLSPYETRIALAEIRTESARKFSITVDELNKIRESNSIEY
jgi:hypothetical protein